MGENGGESRGVCSSCSFLLVKVFGVLSVLSVIIIIIIIKCLSVCACKCFAQLNLWQQCDSPARQFVIHTCCWFERNYILKEQAHIHLRSHLFSALLETYKELTIGDAVRTVGLAVKVLGHALIGILLTTQCLSLLPFHLLILLSVMVTFVGGLVAASSVRGARRLQATAQR